MVEERFRGPTGAVSHRGSQAIMRIFGSTLCEMESLGKVLKKGTLHDLGFYKIRLAAEPGIVYRMEVEEARVAAQKPVRRLLQ